MKNLDRANTGSWYCRLAFSSHNHSANGSGTHPYIPLHWRAPCRPAVTSFSQKKSSISLIFTNYDASMYRPNG